MDFRGLFDSIINYIYSSSLQVLSMSRLGGAGAVAPLVTDIPLSSVEVLNKYVFTT